MLLHLTDYHLESARLALAEGHNESAARGHIDAAAKLIEAIGYKRRLPELEELRGLRRVHSMHQPTEN